MYTYIEIIKNDIEIVKRIDVTGKSVRQIETIENGMNRNLNHEDYYTNETTSDIKLREI